MQLAETITRWGLYPLLRDLCTKTLDDIGENDELLKASMLHTLGMIAQDQGEYEQAHLLYQQSLDIFELLGDQSGRASSLHQLGMIAQQQGEYEQARLLYQQSLDISDQLGNQSGRANSLGQLGLLAYAQGDFENALRYTILAYILFEALRSPFRALAQHTIARIRSHMDEATFITHWRRFAGDLPLPVLSTKETQQLLQEVLIDFINAPTWEASKHILEAHPNLLQPEIDMLLQQLATRQEQDDARKEVEVHRLLLTQCRDKGINAAFAELRGMQQPNVPFLIRILKWLPQRKKK